jgi:hypothetical protein
MSRQCCTPVQRFAAYYCLQLPDPHLPTLPTLLVPHLLCALPAPLQEAEARMWARYLDDVLSGKYETNSRITVAEAVGNATVTLEDLQYACVVVRSDLLPGGPGAGRCGCSGRRPSAPWQQDWYYLGLACYQEPWHRRVAAAASACHRKAHRVQLHAHSARAGPSGPTPPASCRQG